MNANGDNNDPCTLCRAVCSQNDPFYPHGGRPDPCLGSIPGVIHACCGHNKTTPYVVIAPDYEPGTNLSEIPIHSCQTLYSQAALDWFAQRDIGPGTTPNQYQNQTGQKANAAQS